jgi:1-deoxyxylulose-5-phosphate synthase
VDRGDVMETVNLGRCGLRVSRLCIGSMLYGYQCDEQASLAILDRAASLGIDFIDTSDVYPVPVEPAHWGRSEEIIGRWLKGKRDDVVLATKFGNCVGTGRNEHGGSRKHVIEACEASLRRLQTDRVDLYWIHEPDAGTPFEETMEALNRLVQDGKVLYIGSSNLEAWQLSLALLAAAERGLTRFVALQPRYNLLNRHHERDLIPLAQALGLGIVPYSPLGAGVLTGKYRRGQEVPPDSRFGWGAYGEMYQRRYWHDRAFDVADTVAEVAAEEGMTRAQVALAWLLSRDGVTCPIVGASRPEHLDEIVGALERPLSGDALVKLDAASEALR